MRTFSTLVCLSILLFATTPIFAQTIRRVNNAPNVNAPFKTIQDAVTAAAIDDIILVEGSTTPYTGNVLVTKRLRFMGAGYFQASVNPVTQALKLETLGSNLKFLLRAGSDGTIIEGFSELEVRNTDVSGGNIVRTNNITIRRNKDVAVTISALTGVTDLASTNLNLLQNYNLEFSLERVDNSLIQNNYIQGAYSVEIRACNNITIANNVVISFFSYNAMWYGGYGVHLVGYNIHFQNNIFNNSGVTIIPTAPSTITSSNNICSGTQLPSGNGNILNVNMDNVFMTGWNGTLPASLSLDSRFRLRTPDANNSSPNPAVGAGVGGVDCGMFGGSSPYVLSGIPAMPVITQFSSTSSGNATTPLKVKISVKANQ